MKNYKKIDHFEPIAMKCTQEQFKEIKPILEKFKIELFNDFDFNDWLVNCCDGELLVTTLIKNVAITRTKLFYNDFNAKTFLKACGIVEDEPTTKVRNSVLLQLADNNSFSEEIIRKECPKLFESELEVGKWYKGSADFTSLIYITKLTNKGHYNEIFYYGFTFGDYHKISSICNLDHEKSLTLATPQEVETAFKDLFIKMGFVNGVKVSRDWCITKEVEIVGGKIMYHSHSNAITISGREIFKDGKFATIIETPTDIIKIVEKYGKDKIQEYLNYGK